MSQLGSRRSRGSSVEMDGGLSPVVNVLSQIWAAPGVAVGIPRFFLWFSEGFSRVFLSVSGCRPAVADMGSAWRCSVDS